MERGNKRLVVVGGGKMGGAIVAGALASEQYPATEFSASSITVVNPGEARRIQLAETLGVECIANVSEAREADVVILAVKPQIMAEALEQMGSAAFMGSYSDVLFVSIAAGLTTEWLESRLPEGARVVRVMPNMPLLVGAGASGVCAGSAATAEDVDFVAGLFGCMGESVVVDESDMDAVCALSGSGPAYVAWMIEALRDAAVDQGLSAELAERLAIGTVLGTAKYIAETDVTPEQARISICSPGGTTLAALEAMGEAGFADVFAAGVEAAVRRSKELASC